MFAGKYKVKKFTLKNISQRYNMHISTKIYGHCQTADEIKKETVHSCMGLRFKTLNIM
jgi:hypothetical protein